jgi:hypothetical protein
VKPEDAEAIFYQTYGSYPEWREVDKPLIQQELRLKCWKAVIDAITKEVDAQWARRMLDLMSAPKGHTSDSSLV